jgi:hypothetical protein
MKRRLHSRRFPRRTRSGSIAWEREHGRVKRMREQRETANDPSDAPVMTEDAAMLCVRITRKDARMGARLNTHRRLPIHPLPPRRGAARVGHSVVGGRRRLDGSQ